MSPLERTRQTDHKNAMVWYVRMNTSPVMKVQKYIKIAESAKYRQIYVV